MEAPRQNTKDSNRQCGVHLRLKIFVPATGYPRLCRKGCSYEESNNIFEKQWEMNEVTEIFCVLFTSKSAPEVTRPLWPVSTLI